MTEHPHAQAERQIDQAIREAEQPIHDYAREHGVSFDDARTLMGDQAALETRTAELAEQSSAVEWLDTTEREAPRPWSDEDWERDRRRAEAAGVDLDRTLWEAVAGTGKDPVWELAEDRRSEELRQSERFMHVQLAVAQGRETRRKASAPSPAGAGWQPATPDPDTVRRFGVRK